MLSEFERRQLIGEEFPIPLVDPVVLAKIDAVAVAVECAVLAKSALPVRAMADGWGAADTDGNNVGYGCSLDGWMRAVRWAERQHGIGA